jgi:hypothetical protein
MTRYIAEIDTRVAGIPCKIGVIWFARDGGGSESEWHVLDRRGRYAEWLERKLDGPGKDDIEEIIYYALGDD